MSVSRNIKNGIFWVFINQGGNQIITFSIGIILARIIAPEEFGLIAMVTFFTGFAGLFQGLGLNAAVIQSKSVTNTQLSSIYFLNLCVGLFMGAGFYLGAEGISIFYSNPKLILLTKIMALDYPLGSLLSVHSALLVKKMDFKKRTRFNLTSMLLGPLVTIPLALMGYGAMALVAGSLFKRLISIVLHYRYINWRPHFYFSLSAIKELIGFGGVAMFNNILIYTYRNVDNLIIGKFIGDNALGLYKRSYGIMMLPIGKVAQSFKTVLFPSLSKIQDDNKEIGRLYLKSVELTATIVFPLMFILSVLSPYFILSVYGDKWKGAIPILSVLSILGAFQAIKTFNGTIFYVKGKPKLETYMFLITTPLLLTSFIVGAKMGGVIGLTYAYAATSFVLMWFEISVAIKQIHLSVWVLIKRIFPIFFFAVLIYCGLQTLKILVLDNIVVSNLFVFLGLSSLSMIIYVLLHCLFKTQSFNYGKQFADKILKRNNGAK